MRNLLIVKSYCMFPIQIERKSNLWHNYKLPILSWELMQYIFIARLYKCWLLKPVLGISYWTVCIDVFFSEWHCLYILVVMVMALTLCNENEMQTVKIFCGLVKLYLNLIFFYSFQLYLPLKNIIYWQFAFRMIKWVCPHLLEFVVDCYQMY